MSDIITTKSIGADIVEIKEDFILDEKPMSRLVFRAQIHKRGIRGKIIRERRESSNDEWFPDKAIDIRTLGKNESINLVINTEAVKNLYIAISKLANILEQEGIQYGENTYAVVDPDSVIITDDNKVAYIKKIIDAGYDEEIWNNLAESNPSLVTKLSYAKIQSTKQKIVEELDTRLRTGDFSETIGDDSWQSWIYKNSWMFGVTYQKPIEKQKINISGSMPDYLFPTVDGFLDILEIKLPSHDVVVEDSSHVGSFRWSGDTNKAIGQVVTYLGDIELYQLHLKQQIKNKYNLDLSVIKPRAFILIGNSDNWDPTKKESLRKLNFSLHGIKVLTYSDLLQRANEIVEIYNKELS